MSPERTATQSSSHRHILGCSHSPNTSLSVPSFLSIALSHSLFLCISLFLSLWLPTSLWILYVRICHKMIIISSHVLFHIFNISLSLHVSEHIVDFRKWHLLLPLSSIGPSCLSYTTLDIKEKEKRGHLSHTPG